MEKFLYNQIEKKDPKINVWFMFPAIESFAMASLGYLSIFKMLDLNENIYVEDIIEYINNINQKGSEEQKIALNSEIEQAYLEKEIERMYDRLAKTGRDTAVVSDKLTKLKKRKQSAI